MSNSKLLGKIAFFSLWTGEIQNFFFIVKTLKVIALRLLNWIIIPAVASLGEKYNWWISSQIPQNNWAFFIIMLCAYSFICKFYMTSENLTNTGVLTPWLQGVIFSLCPCHEMPSPVKVRSIGKCGFVLEWGTEDLLLLF